MKQEFWQSDLRNVVHKLFPGFNLVTNARKESQLHNRDTGNYFELDIWLPEINLGFEFQDSYHYTTAWYSQIPLDVLRQRDIQKQQKAENSGHTLVIVPCWWDGKQDSLIASIKEHRPDLLKGLPNVGSPISLLPPTGYFKLGKIPDVGELMLASFPEQTTSESIAFVQQNWWMGEKYDGIRCCWNPTIKQLYTRAGVIVPLALSISQSFPNLFMDSEIWYGRGSFSDTQRFFHNTNYCLDRFRLIAFDNPELKLQKLSFERRYDLLLSEVSQSYSPTIVASRMVCLSRKHVNYALKQIIGDDGEGVILRSPNSTYVQGRSNHLIKWKATRGDTEALVIHTNPDYFKFQMPNGHVFRVNTNHIKIKPLPIQGEIVSFSFQKMTKSKEPINPIITRVRADIKWEDVLQSYAEDLQRRDDYNHDLEGQPFASFQAGISRVNQDKEEEMRLQLKAVLLRQKLDPTVPDHWYHIDPSLVRMAKGGKAILRRFGGVVTASLHLFPDLNLVPDKFLFLPQNFWKDINKRRELFDGVAQSLGFDPRVPTHWYPFKIEDLKFKGVKPVLRYYYSSNLGKALTHLYPDVEFDISKFFVSTVQKKSIKQLFDKFAKQHNFDAAIASNWYRVTTKEYLSSENIRYILSRFHSLSAALQSAYPELQFEPERFSFINNDQSEEEKRSFFTNFAHDNGFDPLVKENWYAITYQAIRSAKGSRKVLQPYYGNWRKALLQIFPNIGLDESKFLFMKAKWGELNSQQQWFLKFAEHHNFDPYLPSNWYTVPKSVIMNFKVQGIHSILAHYDGKLENALTNLFPNIGLDKAQLAEYSSEHWDNIDNRRKAVLEFCEKCGFSVSAKLALKYFTKFKFNETVSGKQLMRKYNNDLVAILYDTFPGLFDTKMQRKIAFWQDINNRKSFLLEFAKEMKFDPHVYANWTTQIQNQLRHKKNASSVLAYYHGSVSKALNDLIDM